MNSVLVKVLTISAVIFNVALAKGKNIYRKLEYARVYTDSLRDIQNAIYLYDEIISISKQTAGSDSIWLVAEMERIYLLCNIGRRSEVLKSIKRAEPLARRLDDYEKISSLLCIRGYIYARLGFKNSALSVMEQAMLDVRHIQNEDKRNLHLGYIYGIRVYLGESSSERASDLLKSQYYFERVSANDAEYMVAKKLSNLCYASALVEREQHDFVSHYLSKAMSYLNPENLSLVDHFVIVNFASLQYDDKDFSEVEKWLLYALQSKAEVENNQYIKGSVLHSLYDVMSKKKEYVKANDYLQRFTRIKDSLDKDQIRTISLIEEELATAGGNALSKEAKQNNMSIFTRSSFVIVLFVLAGVLYTKNRKNSRHLTTNFASVTISEPVGLHAAKKNKNEITVDQIDELNTLVKQNSPSFMVKFYEYFPSFLVKVNHLSYTSLNNAELEICAYSKLNFSTKDIALYRKDSVRSVENRKYRIRKKLMLSPETDFVVWISRIN